MLCGGCIYKDTSCKQVNLCLNTVRQLIIFYKKLLLTSRDICGKLMSKRHCQKYNHNKIDELLTERW